jgi:hypothetical protein
MEIDVAKVAWLIRKAREFEAKIAPFDGGDTEEADEQYGAILENRSDDPTLLEMEGFFQGLNDDEETELVALTWIGRGTFDAEDWDEAKQTARQERDGPTSRYLIGMPLLADYLEDGLTAMGVDVAEVEADDEQG